VIFTSMEATLTALKRAAELASQLNVQINLLVLQAVQFPAPIDAPPVRRDWNEERFRAIAAEIPVPIAVRIYLCRDRIDTLHGILCPRSLVVIGSHKRWWPTAERRLARNLRRAGHAVIVTETR
jgi:hypothetical protein